ncbi:Hypothetical predicted protein [Octopus vulgaris]|uniref:Uncharacterized protein n=1 Tax=Octopus vulgaris TaxID=6645 RepID=A0AA36BFT8_OCTVU|nr:Hypothetical predicted protein [Octopus vulgaris]
MSSMTMTTNGCGGDGGGGGEWYGGIGGSSGGGGGGDVDDLNCGVKPKTESFEVLKEQGAKRFIARQKLTAQTGS